MALSEGSPAWTTHFAVKADRYYLRFHVFIKGRSKIMKNLAHPLPTTTTTAPACVGSRSCAAICVGEESCGDVACTADGCKYASHPADKITRPFSLPDRATALRLRCSLKPTIVKFGFTPPVYVASRPGPCPRFPPLRRSRSFKIPVPYQIKIPCHIGVGFLK